MDMAVAAAATAAVALVVAVAVAVVVVLVLVVAVLAAASAVSALSGNSWKSRHLFTRSLCKSQFSGTKACRRHLGDDLGDFRLLPELASQDLGDSLKMAGWMEPCI